MAKNPHKTSLVPHYMVVQQKNIWLSCVIWSKYFFLFCEKSNTRLGKFHLLAQFNEIHRLHFTYLRFVHTYLYFQDSIYKISSSSDWSFYPTFISTFKLTFSLFKMEFWSNSFDVQIGDFRLKKLTGITIKLSFVTFKFNIIDVYVSTFLLLFSTFRLMFSTFKLTEFSSFRPAVMKV